MIGDGPKAGSCQNWDIEQTVCRSGGKTMPMFLVGVLHELSPVIVRGHTVSVAKIAYISHGMLTGQNNYRNINAVIVRFYRLGRIIGIMGHVSVLQRREGQRNC